MKEKFKNITEKGIVSIVVVAVSLILTIVVSITNVILDPTRFDFGTWVGNAGISVGLSLIGMFCGEAIFGGIMMNDVNKKYQQALAEFEIARRNVNDITAYLQKYLDDAYFQEIKTFKYDLLIQNNIEQPEQILKLDIKQIDQLENPCKLELDGKVVYFKSYTKEQIKLIHDILEGEYKIKRIGKEFFLNSDSKTSSSSDYQEAGRLIKEKKIVVNTSRIIKVVSIVVVSAFTSMLVVQDVMSAGDAQAWVSLFTRIFNLALGLWSGYITASLAVQEDVKAFKFKTVKLKEFKQDYEKHPQKYEEAKVENQAKKEYEEFVKKEEERQAKIVIPEIVNDFSNTSFFELENKGGFIDEQGKH